MDSKENRPPFLRVEKDGLILSAKVQPRASKNSIESAIGGELRIKVTAPPVDAAANDALIWFLAETFDMPRNKIELLRGHTSRHKTLKLYGLSEAAFTSKLKVEHRTDY